MYITTRINVKGKDLNIGTFDTETKVWYIDRDKSKHFHRKMQAWGLDWEVYKNLRMFEKLEKVKIMDRKLEKTWTIDYITIRNRKMFKNFPPHRIQIFIPEEAWKVEDIMGVKV